MTCHGGELPGEWFRGYLSGLVERDCLGSVRAILTGYLGSRDKAHDLAQWLSSVRQSYPSIPVIVDPVMGDEDSGFYIPQKLPMCIAMKYCRLQRVSSPINLNSRH